jgi:hypothetical protein
MAETKLKTVAKIISMEQLTSKFGSSATLAGAGFTIPSNTGDVWCYPSAACWWNPLTTAVAAAPSHAVAASEMFKIPNAKLATAEIIGASGSITLTVAYMRGSRKSIQHAVVRPY